MDSHPARWWRTLEADDLGRPRVECQLCPRFCHIPEGQRGFCFVRANEGGRLVLTTWGRSSGLCIDPIEKKPLNHFLPGSAVLSLGTAGCNLGCKFCQNHEISKSRAVDTIAQQASPDQIVQRAIQTNCKSLAYTYNDPVIWAEYAIDIAKAAREAGLKSVAVTAGYMCDEPRREFYQHMDAANVDLKGFSDKFYRSLTQTSLAPVLETLEYLVNNTRVWVEVTNLIIPGHNDDPDEIARMCDWYVEHLSPDVPLHFTAFHPDFRMMDTPGTSHGLLRLARSLAQRAGIRYVYTGNIRDEAGQSTCCSTCGDIVIGRDGYRITSYRLTGELGNRCASCGAQFPGVFDSSGQPGDWGPRRLPVLA
ncbi:MAG: AmmeMemoRadiSam system radical SAM enzyme [Phycisphaera sp.]|nr:AmmeMemoRadiSam system radical SAM enzyme [Phycisphaera sp.]